MPRERISHEDSYLNLGGEILSVYPTTILYYWNSLTSSDGQYPVLEDTQSLIGLEARTGGYVVAVEEGTVNLLEANSINTAFDDLTGWSISVKDTAGANTDFATIMNNEQLTSKSEYFVRLYSGSNTSEEIILQSDATSFMSIATAHALSLYYRTNTTNTNGKVKVEIIDTTYGSIDITYLDLSDNWDRAVILFTTPLELNNQQIKISINFSGYVDITALQLEAKSFATSWHNSATQRTDGFLKLADDNEYPEFFGEDQIAISTWVKFRQYKHAISQSIVGCATSGYKLWKTPGGYIEFTVQLFDGSFARANFDRDLLPLNEWHMVTGIFTGGHITIYLDGQMKDSASSPELIYYKDDDVLSISSKQLYVSIDPNLIPADLMTRVLFFEPKKFDERIKVLAFNPGSGLFYDSVGTPDIIDFNFQVTTPIDAFNIPLAEPTDTNNQVWVFCNGSLQQETVGTGPTNDYDIVPGTGAPNFNVVFNTNRDILDVIQVYVIEDATGADVTRYDWTATSAQTQFTGISSYTKDGQHLVVFCNGICMTLGLSADYTEDVSGTSFTFVSGRETGDKITAFRFGGTDYFSFQDFKATEGQANFQLNPTYDIDDSVLVFANGMLNASTSDYITSTQDLLNALLRYTRIEPGRVNILLSFVRFIQARLSGDIIDILHFNPDDEVPGAFEHHFKIHTATNSVTVDRGIPSAPDDHLLVFTNGLLQIKTTDYTATGNSTETIITFTADRQINDLIKVIYINEETTTLHRQDTTVSGGPQTEFTISGGYINDSEHLMVFTNGVMNIEGGARYYVETDGTKITFNVARQNGDVVSIFKIDSPSKVEHDIYDVATSTFNFSFANDYTYYVYNLINGSGIVQSIDEDYGYSEVGEITSLNINSQVIQNWYENDLIYDWKYKETI